MSRDEDPLPKQSPSAFLLDDLPPADRTFNPGDHPSGHNPNWNRSGSISGEGILMADGQIATGTITLGPEHSTISKTSSTSLLSGPAEGAAGHYATPSEQSTASKSGNDGSGGMNDGAGGTNSQGLVSMVVEDVDGDG